MLKGSMRAKHLVTWMEFEMEMLKVAEMVKSMEILKVAERVKSMEMLKDIEMVKSMVILRASQLDIVMVSKKDPRMAL